VNSFGSFTGLTFRWSCVRVLTALDFSKQSISAYVRERFGSVGPVNNLFHLLGRKRHTSGLHGATDTADSAAPDFRAPSLLTSLIDSVQFSSKVFFGIGRRVHLNNIYTLSSTYSPRPRADSAAGKLILRLMPSTSAPSPSPPAETEETQSPTGGATARPLPRKKSVSGILNKSCFAAFGTLEPFNLSPHRTAHQAGGALLLLFGDLQDAGVQFRGHADP
jgi:hypothetical protein